MKRKGYPKNAILKKQTQLGKVKGRWNEKGTCGDGTTGGVDVHVDGFVWVFGFEEEELRHDDVRSVVGDGSIDADNALLEEAREDVVSPFSSGRVLNHHWDETVRTTTTALGLHVPSMEQQLLHQRVRASHKTSHGFRS